VICTVTVGELDLDSGRTEFVDHTIACFDDLVRFFDEVYDDGASQLKEMTGDALVDKSSGEPIGGFSARVSNNFGGRIEVGIGRDWWLLIDLVPKGARFITGSTPAQTDFIFFLDGWHYTGIGSDDVIPRDECLAAIEKWLDGHDLNGDT
tara:strand:- start:1734 stop:2183 length:450 start_codon:yes stop_codon:yes gene_type:complete